MMMFDPSSTKCEVQAHWDLSQQEVCEPSHHVSSQRPDPVWGSVQSIFLMKLYIWLSTTKWTGRQERRSWVAGSHVSQERALYCSRTNLWREDGAVSALGIELVSLDSLLGRRAYLSTSEVWFESSGWECLLCRSSSDWTEDTCRCREAWQEKRSKQKSDRGTVVTSAPVSKPRQAGIMRLHIDLVEEKEGSALTESQYLEEEWTLVLGLRAGGPEPVRQWSGLGCGHEVAQSHWLL